MPKLCYKSRIIWPYYSCLWLYDSDIPLVRIDFQRDGAHDIQPKSLQFPFKFNYGSAERRLLPKIGCKLFAEGQVYVALSQIRSLTDLQIEELYCTQLISKTPCGVDILIKKPLLNQQHFLNVTSNLAIQKFFTSYNIISIKN